MHETIEPAVRAPHGFDLARVAHLGLARHDTRDEWLVAMCRMWDKLFPLMRPDA